jgi:fluoride exporter
LSEHASRTAAILWVGAGGAIGALGRYALLQWLGSVDDGSLPWGTLVANIAGSLLLGLVIGSFERGAFGTQARLFLAVGLFGSFTTFSFFSYENLELMRDARFVALAVNAGVQLVLGIAAAVIGFAISRRI